MRIVWSIAQLKMSLIISAKCLWVQTFRRDMVRSFSNRVAYSTTRHKKNVTMKCRNSSLTLLLSVTSGRSERNSLLMWKDVEIQECCIGIFPTWYNLKKHLSIWTMEQCPLTWNWSLEHKGWRSTVPTWFRYCTLDMQQFKLFHDDLLQQKINCQQCAQQNKRHEAQFRQQGTFAGNVRWMEKIRKASLQNLAFSNAQTKSLWKSDNLVVLFYTIRNIYPLTKEEGKTRALQENSKLRRKWTLCTEQRWRRAEIASHSAAENLRRNDCSAWVKEYFWNLKTAQWNIRWMHTHTDASALITNSHTCSLIHPHVHTHAQKIAPWSSRWFEEILISLTLTSLTLISLTLILVTFLSKILTFFMLCMGVLIPVSFLSHRLAEPCRSFCPEKGARSPISVGRVA